MPKLNDEQMMKLLKQRLKGRGELKAISFELTHRFFNEEFIHRCVDELKNVRIRVMMGEGINPLEHLAYSILMDAAGIEPQQEYSEEDIEDLFDD